MDHATQIQQPNLDVVEVWLEEDLGRSCAVRKACMGGWRQEARMGGYREVWRGCVCTGTPAQMHVMAA